MTAYLVVGPESSGTRLVTRILMAAGCGGSDKHRQPFDLEVPSGLSNLVWRRSFPHRGVTPDLEDLVVKLNEAGYIDVSAVVTHRDMYSTMRSQVDNRTPGSLRVAMTRYRSAYLSIYLQLIELDLPYYTVSYEALILEPEMVPRKLLKMLSLSQEVELEEIYDGNKVYYHT